VRVSGMVVVPAKVSKFIAESSWSEGGRSPL